MHQQLTTFAALLALIILTGSLAAIAHDALERWVNQ